MESILPPDEIKAVMSQTALKYIWELEKQHAAHGELNVVKAIILAATSSRNYTEWLDDPNMELEFNRKFEPLESNITQNNQPVICPQCTGRGVIFDRFSGATSVEQNCPKCHGGGLI